MKQQFSYGSSLREIMVWMLPVVIFVEYFNVTIHYLGPILRKGY